MNLTLSANSASPKYPRVAKPTKALVVLPAYNEEQHIAALLEKIDDPVRRREINYQVIVVDDGSVDQTLSAAEGWSRKSTGERLLPPIEPGFW